ncbi:MAG TPA: hypothetical protein VGA95_05915 [Thermodesulfobacteriota bacterium]
MGCSGGLQSSIFTGDLTCPEVLSSERFDIAQHRLAELSKDRRKVAATF